MSHATPPRAVRVTRVFEPTRLAEEALRGVYRLLAGAPAKKIARPPVLPALETVQGTEDKRA